MGAHRIEIMGIDQMTLELAKKVQGITLAEGDDLFPLVHCICCASSIYTAYPACCGVQQSQQCCCYSKMAAFKCLQFEDRNKAILITESAAKCIDCTGDASVCHEAAEDTICCWCITGAQKTWMGTSDMDPCFTQGNSLCCDQRLALPPADDTVPMGIACCGATLWGTPLKDAKAPPGAATAEAKPDAAPEAPKDTSA